MTHDDFIKIRDFMFYNFVKYRKSLTETEVILDSFDAFKMTESLAILLDMAKEEVMKDFLKYIAIQKQLGNNF